MLLFDEYQRLGHNILAAQEQLAQWGHKQPDGERQKQAGLRNAQSMSALRQMMAGVQKRV